MTDRLNFSADVQLIAERGTDKPPRVSIDPAYSGGVLRLADWGHVILDTSGLDVSRQIPLLADHRAEMGAIVGRGRAVVADGKLSLTGSLTTATESGKIVVELGRAGHPLQASVGVEVYEREHVKPGEMAAVNGQSFLASGSGLTVVRTGVLRETSLVALGADRGTTVSISASQGTQNMAKQPSNQQSQPPEPTAFHNWLTERAWDPAALSERQRDSLHASFLLETGQQLALTASQRHDLNARDAELENLRSSRPQMTSFKTRSSSSDMDGKVLEASLALHARMPNIEKHYPERVLEAADLQRGRWGLQQIIIQAAINGGYQPDAAVVRLQDNSVLRRVLAHAFPDLKAEFSTVSLPGILSNVANKFIVDAFDEAAGTEWQAISRIEAARDFKEHTFYRLLDSLEYEKLGPTGEIQHGTLGDKSYTARAETYARMLALTRQDIVNDDAAALAAVPMRLGQAAGMAFRRVFWRTFLDHDDFFSAAHGNLRSGGTSVFSADNLESALTAFRAMRSSDADGSKKLGGRPQSLLVPPELEIAARKQLNSSNVVAGGDTDVGVVPAGNPFAGLADLLVSDWINDDDLGENASDKSWYMLRRPSLAPCMVVLFLNGQQRPTVESAEADFNTLGIAMRGYHDFGVSLAEPACGLKMAGE